MKRRELTKFRLSVRHPAKAPANSLKSPDVLGLSRGGFPCICALPMDFAAERGIVGNQRRRRACITR